MTNLEVREVAMVDQDGGVNLQEHVSTTDKGLDDGQEFFFVGQIVQLSPVKRPDSIATKCLNWVVGLTWEMANPNRRRKRRFGEWSDTKDRNE